MPRLLPFQRRIPGLTISVDAGSLNRDLSIREADIALRLNKPPDKSNYVSRRVGQMRMMLFAAKSYLREVGPLNSLNDIANHFIVDYEIAPPGPVWNEWRSIIAASRGIVFSSNSSTAVGLAIAEGYGVGMMAAYASEVDSRLVELPIEIGGPIEIWAVTHEETNKSRRVRATLDFIYQLFEVDKFRFFAR